MFDNILCCSEVFETFPLITKGRITGIKFPMIKVKDR